MSRKGTFFVGAAILAVPLGAAAQERPAAPPTALDEIVVTAERREQRLQDVPLAVTAITADQLKGGGITSTNDIQLATPGLYFAQLGQSAQPTIRGVGTSVTSAGSPANVSVYLDGVYQPNQIANVFDLPDVEQIQVLKGPQGTLYGMNATGGAIIITTRRPKFVPEGRVSLSYGSYGEVRGSAFVTGPITDRLAGSVSFDSVHDEGYVRNFATNNRIAKNDQDAVRGKLLLQATDDISLLWTAFYIRHSNNAGPSVKALDRNLGALRTNPTIFIPSGTYEVAESDDPVDRATSYGTSLTARYKTSFGTFDSVTSFAKTQPEVVADTDWTALPTSVTAYRVTEKTFAEELVFSSDFEGPLNITAGLFYFDDFTHRYTWNARGLQGPVINNYFLTISDDALALYGEAHYALTDRLRLTLGTRYSDESKAFAGVGAPGATPLGPAVRINKASWSNWTHRFSALYELTDAANVYFTFSQGFKSGAFNTSFQTSGAPSQPDPIRPEEVDALEIGYKYAAGGLRFNASAYHYDYKDIQVQILTSINGGNTTLLQNAATAKIRGFDADFAAQLSERWSISGGVAFTDAKYDKYPGALLTFPIAGGGNRQELAPGGANGNQMIRAPRWTGNVSANYAQPLADGATVEANVLASYNSGFYWDPGNRVKMGSHLVLNGRLSWLSPDEKFRFSVWGRNLLDEAIQIYSTQSSIGDSVAYGRPRTFGVSLDVNFD